MDCHLSIHTETQCSFCIRKGKNGKTAVFPGGYGRIGEVLMGGYGRIGVYRVKVGATLLASGLGKQRSFYG